MNIYKYGHIWNGSIKGTSIYENCKKQNNQN